MIFFSPNGKYSEESDYDSRFTEEVRTRQVCDRPEAMRSRNGGACLLTWAVGLQNLTLSTLLKPSSHPSLPS